MKKLISLNNQDDYTLDYNKMDLDSALDLAEIDDGVLKRIQSGALAKARGTHEDTVPKAKKRRFGRWFERRTRFERVAAALLCLFVLSGATLGCIALIRQYVPGAGIVSSGSKLRVLATPYTIWKDDYYLRVTSLSYNSDTKVLNFSAESNWYDFEYPEVDASGNSMGLCGIFLKEHWSKAMPFDEFTGKGFYQHATRNTVTQYTDELKLTKELKDYYLELNIVKVSSSGENQADYTFLPEYIVIPISELDLVPAVKADGLEDFGRTIESSGIRAVSVSQWNEGKLFTDVLFKSSDPTEQVTGINSADRESIELIASDGTSYPNISGQSSLIGWKYLLFEAEKPVSGVVTLHSLSIKKAVNKEVWLNLPKLGETVTLDRAVAIGDVKVVLESIRVYNENIVDDGGKTVTYPLPDNTIGIDVKYRLIEGLSDHRRIDERSQLRGELRIDGKENKAMTHIWGSDGLTVSSHFNKQELENASEITFLIKDILLTVEGEWTIPIE